MMYGNIIKTLQNLGYFPSTMIYGCYGCYRDVVVPPMSKNSRGMFPAESRFQGAAPKIGGLPTDKKHTLHVTDTTKTCPILYIYRPSKYPKNNMLIKLSISIFTMS